MSEKAESNPDMPKVENIELVALPKYKWVVYPFGKGDDDTYTGLIQ